MIELFIYHYIQIIIFFIFFNLLVLVMSQEPVYFAMHLYQDSIVDFRKSRIWLAYSKMEIWAKCFVSHVTVKVAIRKKTSARKNRSQSSNLSGIGTVSE